MDIEILTRKPETTPHPTPILFIHGAWHGAWCWAEHFLPYFAERGYTAHALSLRGHGASAGRDRLRWASIADYVSDVAQVTQQFSTLPILIGHSMGGLVAQKYLEAHSAPAAVLLASVPTEGVIRTVLRIIAHHPLVFLRANLTLSLYPIVGTPTRTREMFFSADLPADQVNRHFARLQDEAYRAFLDMLLFNLPRPRRVQTPLLVLGAANDTVFHPNVVQATARAYHTRAEIFPHMAHDMMLEAGWQAVADRMINWLQAQSL